MLLPSSTRAFFWKVRDPLPIYVWKSQKLYIFIFEFILYKLKPLRRSWATLSIVNPKRNFRALIPIGAIDIIILLNTLRALYILCTFYLCSVKFTYFKKFFNVFLSKFEIFWEGKTIRAYFKLTLFIIRIYYTTL